MEVSPRSSPRLEHGGVRGALKRLSLRGFNGWTSGKHVADGTEGDSCESNGICPTEQCNGAVSNKETTSCSDDLSRAEEICSTPITDIDSLVMLAAMNEANRYVMRFDVSLCSRRRVIQ